MKILGIDFSYSAVGMTLYSAGTYSHCTLVNKAVFSKSKLKSLDSILHDTPLLKALQEHGVQVTMIDREPTSIPPKTIKDKTTKKKIANPEWHWNSISDWHKLHHAQTRTWSSALLTIIKGMNLAPGDSIILENYDFGQRGATDNIIQMVEHTYALKQQLLEQYPEVNFYLASSSEIKKVAGSGNYNKYDMYQAFLQETTNSSMLEFLRSTPTTLSIKNSQVVLSPVNDIIDSYYAVRYLLSKIETE